MDRNLCDGCAFEQSDSDCKQCNTCLNWVDGYLSAENYQNKALNLIKEIERCTFLIPNINPKIEDYFLDQYGKASFTVVPGHWPEMNTKEDVDNWIAESKSVITYVLNRKHSE